MKRIEHALYVILGEPFTWFFYWCFQPRGFRREFENGSSDLCSIERQCGLSRRTARWALETLLDRNLVLLNEQGIYQIAVPIFGEWLEQSVIR